MELSGKNILITGGAGFIGSHLAQRLAESNFVRIVDDFSTGCLENLCGLEGGKKVEVIEGDVSDRESAASWCDGVDVVFHLAVSCLRTSLGNPRASHDVNAGGTLNLCEAAARCGVGRFVYVSSSEVYGSARYVPMAETHPLEPTTVYGAAKLAGELYAKAYHRTYGLPAVIVRPFNTYGPREPWRGKRAEVIPRFILQAFAGEAPVIFGDGKQTRDFTYVEDTVKGIVMAAECDDLIGGVINIAHGHELSISTISTLIRDSVGGETPAPTFEDPRPGDVLRHVADVSKARELLGFSASTDIRAGLIRSIDWFEKNVCPESLVEAGAAKTNW